MKVLFICKWNRFRSKVAEYLFNQMSKKNKAKSVGLIEANVPLRPGEIQRKNYLKEKFQISLNDISRGINVNDLEEADKIIIVADDVDSKILNHWRFREKVETWKIPDESASNEEKINKIVNSIRQKVENLIIEMEDKK